MFDTSSSWEPKLKQLTVELIQLLEGRNIKEISDDYAHTNGSYKRYTNAIIEKREEFIELLKIIR